MEKRKKVLISLAALALILVIAVIAVHFLGKGRISATTMRLLRIEGEVSLESGGKTKKIVDNLRLARGDIVSTKSNSLASIALDDSKAVTLQEQSSAEFKQKGKKLELNLTAGSLFFEVSKKLKDDESFEIRTSSMMVGIRGTSGYVYVQKDGKDGILLTDGEVEVEHIPTYILRGVECVGNGEGGAVEMLVNRNLPPTPPQGRGVAILRLP